MFLQSDGKLFLIANIDTNYLHSLCDFNFKRSLKYKGFIKLN